MDDIFVFYRETNHLLKILLQLKKKAFGKRDDEKSSCARWQTVRLFPVQQHYRRACPGTAGQTGESGRRTPPGRRGLRRAETPWPSATPCRLWPPPRRRSRCLSVWPRPPPPPRGPEDVRRSRWRPRWEPEERENLRIRGRLNTWRDVQCFPQMVKSEFVMLTQLTKQNN